MTRFARAKGSKASNERAPEDGTPWEVMKRQLLQAKQQDQDSKLRKEAEQKRIENYENFLKEQKIQKRKAVWCEFDNNVNSKLSNNFNEPITRNKNNKRNSESFVKDDSGSVGNEPETSGKKKKKQKQKNKIEHDLNVDEATESNVDDLNGEVPVKSSNEEKKQKKKKKNNNKLTIDGEYESFIESKKIENDAANVEPAKKKKKVITQTKLGDSEENISNTDNLQESNLQSKKRKQGPDIPQKAQNAAVQNENFKNKKGKKQHFDNPGDASENTEFNSSQNKQAPKAKKKKTKFVDGKPVRRKPIDDNSFQLIINGRDVELARFDGFIIMKKDEERLKDLKKNMMQKGIPKSEVQRTIKLERRRAEKALARLKRDVCYNCRKGGHNLSDCPDLKSKIPSTETAEGVCFKCGSTEHRQFECKVQRDKEFRFATCFICREQGHIARQCPDNPKGLYPNGGGCNLCGDVTHLKKDCPTINDKKEGSNIKLSTLDSTDNIEDLPDQTKTGSVIETVKKPKKIKF